MSNNPSANLEIIHERIVRACQTVQRRSDAVKLIAVSKMKSQADVINLLQAGHRLFGENRVQEAAGKFIDLRASYPDLELHLIGPLQTNKAEDAVSLFDVIETLDRPKLAEALAKAMRKTGRHPRCYIEVNLGDEPQKAGIAPEELEHFLKFCRQDCGLTIDGLMCIPPQLGDPENYFNALKKLADQNNLSCRSMGMSADFETAIRCGATHVRIGSALFGAR